MESLSKTIKATLQWPLLVASVIIIIAAAMYGQSIINPLLMAIFINIICAQPLFWLKKKVPDGLAVSIIVFSIIGAYVLFFELVGTSLSSFMENAPEYEKNLASMTKDFDQFLRENGINLSIIRSNSSFDPSKIMSYSTSILGSMGDVMSSQFTFLFLTFFLIAEVESFSNKISWIAKSADKSIGYLNTLGKDIRHYLRIKTITSLLTGLLITIALAIVGVDYAILWGFIAFLLNYIPNIGSFIAAIPAVLFSLIQVGFMGAVWTMAIFVAVNMIVGNIIEPKMMGKGLGLSTFIIFLGLLFWGFVLGTVGMFLSVPLMLAIKIILEQNPKTKWVAFLLGTESVDEKKKSLLA